jgi:hypothetical protein
MTIGTTQLVTDEGILTIVGAAVAAVGAWYNRTNVPSIVSLTCNLTSVPLVIVGTCSAVFPHDPDRSMAELNVDPEAIVTLKTETGPTVAMIHPFFIYRL